MFYGPSNPTFYLRTDLRTDHIKEMTGHVRQLLKAGVLKNPRENLKPIIAALSGIREGLMRLEKPQELGIGLVRDLNMISHVVERKITFKVLSTQGNKEDAISEYSVVQRFVDAIRALNVRKSSATLYGGTSMSHILDQYDSEVDSDPYGTASMCCSIL